MQSIKCPKCGEVITLDENTYTEILSQVKTNEFKEELQTQVNAIRAQYEAEKKTALADANNASNKTIETLKAENEQLKKDHSTAIELAEAKVKESQEAIIRELREQILKLQSESKLAEAKVKESQEAIINELKEELLKVKSESELAIKDVQLEAQTLRDDYEHKLAMKDEDIERWKNYRMGDSTKDLGESLEKYCSDRFEEMRAVAYPHAYFEKDNQVVEGGKADFLFKDFTDDNIELCSIIFDMKTEKDTTATKHKNEHFFEKLDKDREKKGYQFAVLVSTLEADSELYNRGIVDVSHKYPNMFVVRPTHFMAIIGLIRNLSLRAVAEKRALMEYQRDNADLTAFEQSLMAFKLDAGANYERAKTSFDKAIDEIDKSIKALEEAKAKLLASTKQLRIGTEKVQEITIKKLTKGNDGMQQQFIEAGIDINKKSN